MNPVAARRIPREIERVDDLSGLGIYYVNNTDTFMKGHAMIIGPEDTPYAHCLFFFKFEFPDEYPFSPPKVEFLTSDGKTRFHPNLYVNGKVCLSILGTYVGPGWQSTMSLSMVLISLRTLFDENPLTNEPGYERLSKDDIRAKEYRELVQYRIAAYTLHELKKKYRIPLFDEYAADAIALSSEKLRALIKIRSEEPVLHYTNVVYNMGGSINWKLLDMDSNGLT
jgi:ubiquitin-protein ligase